MMPYLLLRVQFEAGDEKPQPRLNRLPVRIRFNAELTFVESITRFLSPALALVSGGNLDFIANLVVTLTENKPIIIGVKLDPQSSD